MNDFLRGRDIELVLAAVAAVQRAGRDATVVAVARVLGWPRERAAEHLAGLVEAGDLRRVWLEPAGEVRFEMAIARGSGAGRRA